MSSRCSRATRGPTVPSPKPGGGSLRTKAQGGEGAAAHSPLPCSGSFEGKIGGRWGTPHKCCCQPPLALAAAGEAQHALSMEGHFPGGPPRLCQPGTRDGDAGQCTLRQPTPVGPSPRPVGLEVPSPCRALEGPTLVSRYVCSTNPHLDSAPCREVLSTGAHIHDLGCRGG